MPRNLDQPQTQRGIQTVRKILNRWLFAAPVKTNNKWILPIFYHRRFASSVPGSVIVGTHGSKTTRAIRFRRKPPWTRLSLIIFQHVISICTHTNAVDEALCNLLTLCKIFTDNNNNNNSFKK